MSKYEPELSDQKNTLMQMQVSLPKKLIISTLIMALLILLVFLLNIPNPNMILIAGLVLCSAMFGYGGGLIAAAIMLFYTLFFFSSDHSMISFTSENLQKVIVSVIGIGADMLLVCALKSAELDAFRQIAKLTNELQEENRQLQKISLTDALTGIRNRMALAKDHDGYCHSTVTVMMLDLDKFKTINDTCGHEEGDRVLKETVWLLKRAFGAEHCYRFGGDEFLVILPDAEEEEFIKKLDTVVNEGPSINIAGEDTTVGFSYGYVRRAITEHSELTKMFSEADEKMYENKRKKN